MAKRYKLHYLPLAMADLLDISSYISDHLHAPQAASELIDRLDKALSRLEQFPYSGHPYVNSKLRENYRMLVVEDYLVFYVVYEDDSRVEIRRVIHGKRDYKKLLRILP